MVKIGVTEEENMLVPAAMLSTCLNSGKCLLLTSVSFKDGGSRFPGFVNDSWC